MNNKFEVRSSQFVSTELRHKLKTKNSKLRAHHTALPTPIRADWILRSLIATIILYGTLLPATANAISGREIYDKVHEVATRQLDRKTEATMVLLDKGGGKRTRTLTEFSKNADPEAYKVLVVFNTPPDLKNVGFLIHAHKIGRAHV